MEGISEHKDTEIQSSLPKRNKALYLCVSVFYLSIMFRCLRRSPEGDELAAHGGRIRQGKAAVTLRHEKAARKSFHEDSRAVLSCFSHGDMKVTSISRCVIALTA